ncbi:MAG: hypothetical protein ACK559_29450, partial [bacterium]
HSTLPYSQTDTPLKLSVKTLERKTEDSPRSPPQPQFIPTPACLRKRKHLDYKMFLPFLKIVQKILTRWSQVTKKMKDKTNPK